jgi:signal transduction histidine kinase
VIIGNLDLLREKFRNQGTNRELIDDSLSSALSGRELVQRLLAFGSRQGLEPEPVDPNNIVLRLSRLLKRKLGETIKIRSVLNDDLWPIAVDKRQFEMSLLNLIFIARDAMTHGGRLTIESKNIVVHPPFGEHETTPGSYVTLAVIDTGTGMTADVAAQALQPFFTTKLPSSGSGLGLSMVYGFVKQSGGYLTIDTKPGDGTSVTLYLPMANDDRARAESRVAA